MRAVLSFSLLISAAVCGSLVQLNQKPVVLADECAGLTYSDPIGGIITSPNYPSSYSNNLVCSYLIDLRSSADFIYLRFLDVNIQTRYDYITIYDGPTVDDVPLSNVSGSDIPGGLEGLRSRSGQMLITFTTDGSFSNYNGFLATYSNGAATGCGKTYTDVTGNIMPTYPADFSGSLDCQYKINLRFVGATSVNLTFSEFSTQNDDYVLVYEGLVISGELLLNATGSEIPPPVVSKTSQILVRYVKSGNGGSSSFLATYTGI